MMNATTNVRAAIRGAIGPLVAALLALLTVGLLGPAVAQAATATRTPTIVATVHASRSATPTRTPTVAGTATPTGTPGPTRTPAPRVVWSAERLAPVLAPGVPTEQTVTFRVTAAVRGATVRVMSRGGIAAAPIPGDLVPGQDYPVRLTLTLPTNRAAWPMHGSVAVQAGGHSLGALLLVRATGDDAGGGADRTPTPRGTGTPEAGAGGGATPTPRPSSAHATATRRPTAARLRWDPSSVAAAVPAGGSVRVDVSFVPSAAVAAPKFEVHARDGAVALDPATLPSALESGRRYTIGLVLSLPEGRRPVAHSGVVLVRDGQHTLAQPLTVRVSPAS